MVPDFLLLPATAGEPRTKLLKLPGLVGLWLFPRLRLSRVGRVGLAGRAGLLVLLDLTGAGGTLLVNRAGEEGAEGTWGAAVLAKEDGNWGRTLLPRLLPKLLCGVTLLRRLL